MNLNLITDAWIPVRMRDGSQHRIAPWQMADAGIAALDWPRMDLNIACTELLVGLLYLADPPESHADWQARRQPDPQRLRDRLAPFAHAFHLLGDGPRFLQDLEPLSGKASPPDMLFIDSAGESTAEKNADLMTRRGRYPCLDLPLAAIALYTFQSFAPAGGSGNRTSMRGGGPQVTLIDPGEGLWPMLWANVPNGTPALTAHVLPWMQPTVVSKDGTQVWPQDRHPCEVFFGMPRRLRLIEADGLITGVVQRPHGNSYAGWQHPLTPYYRTKSGGELFPRHPPAGRFSYRHWLGVVAADAKQEQDGFQQRAATVANWQKRMRNQPAQLVVAGWAMSNMQPLDFSYAQAPLLALSLEAEDALAGWILAAEQFSLALRQALQPAMSESHAREAVREHFFIRTQARFEEHLHQLQQDTNVSEVAQRWCAHMRNEALKLFDAQALPCLPKRDWHAQQLIVQARHMLLGAFSGRSKYGKAAYAALNLPLPSSKVLKETPST